MDFRTKDELLLQKRLTRTAKKIRENRKKSNKIKKEIQQFQEIKELLNKSEEEGSVAAKQPNNSPAPYTTYTTPISAPGIEIFQEDNAFWMFNEETLCLKDFVLDKERVNIFGKDAEVPKEDLFRDLIAHHITESILSQNENCHSVSLYVLYLMSVHTDKYFVNSCVDFLKYRRFEISAAEILPIFCNFGSSYEVLVGTELPLELPKITNHSPRKTNGGNVFPFYNAEMVANIILHYSALDLIRREPDVKLLLIAFTRLTLDCKIRYSRLFSIYSSLISVLSNQLIDTLGVDSVVSCLHLKDEHILNQVEIARVVLMPISPLLHKTLIVHIINFIFNSHVLKISDWPKVKGVIKVLKKLKRGNLTPLQVYCILELINGSLPDVTATAKQVGDINCALLSLEACFFNVKDCVDLIRVKLEIAKLRNLVTDSADKDLPTCYLNLSQMGNRK